MNQPHPILQHEAMKAQREQEIMILRFMQIIDTSSATIARMQTLHQNNFGPLKAGIIANATNAARVASIRLDELLSDLEGADGGELESEQSERKEET